ncbi:MAG: phytanoyl-CoA dioxygenase family protein [Pirellulaceae bacterium]
MQQTAANQSALAGEYPLTRQQIDAFRRDGHTLLRGVASPEEVAPYRQIIVELVRRLNQETRPLEQRDAYGQAFLKGLNLWPLDERVKTFVCARRFARIAAQLLGVAGVRIYHDQALFKEADGGYTPWHQDQHYWPLETDATVTMWMPLVPVTAEMGTMRFASGSHRHGYLGDLPISDQSEELLEQFIRARGYARVQAPAMAAGDTTWHYGWTLHGAPGNCSDRPREVMTIIYYADGTRVKQPDNANRQRDLGRWLPGLQPGDVAASPLNPRVYLRSE